MPQDRYQRVQEVADRFEVAEATVRQWIKAGTLRAVDIGKGWRMENHLRATAPDLEAARAAAGEVHPIGTTGEPDDIAWAVVWLASDEAKFVTGTETFIGGGLTAR